MIGRAGPDSDANAGTTAATSRKNGSPGGNADSHPAAPTSTSAASHSEPTR